MNLFSQSAPASFAPSALTVDADFISFDFETANRSAASACSIGLALVKNGEIIANPSWLICPPTLEFDPAFIKIHGLTAEKVKDAPHFAELWYELKPYFENRILVAHNAEFDVAVLSNMLRHYDIPRPIFRYSCTKIIAQNTWPSWKRYNLAALAERNGFSFNHHDAGDDARVCAQIALQALTVKAANDLAELNSKLNLSFGQFNSDNYTPVGVNLYLPEIGNLGRWDEKIHKLPEQIKRLKRALDLTEAEIDRASLSGVINGYLVSPDQCSCIDFRERKMPCKHIYHLMIKLNEPDK